MRLKYVSTPQIPYYTTGASLKHTVLRCNKMYYVLITAPQLRVRKIEGNFRYLITGLSYRLFFFYFFFNKKKMGEGSKIQGKCGVIFTTKIS